MKELDAKRTLHIKTNAIRDGFQNRPIERYHNVIRAVTKSKRGLGNDKSAQEFIDGYRIYHNYVRPHSGLPEQQTPAEATNIRIEGMNKWLTIIQNAVHTQQKTQTMANSA